MTSLTTANRPPVQKTQTARFGSGITAFGQSALTRSGSDDLFSFTGSTRSWSRSPITSRNDGSP